MEKTVVVMSAADVAAMRKTHKEAEAAYFEAKVGALKFALSEMESTGKEYTLHELTALTGLSPLEISAQFGACDCYCGPNCKAAEAAGAGAYHIRHGEKITERHFVEVVNGEINPNSVKTFVRRETTYAIPKRR